MGVLKKILKLLHLLTVVSSIIFMILLVLIVFTHVVLRYVFNSGLSWSEEVASFMLVPAFVFLGMALGVDEKIHINIDILSKRIPKWFDNFLEKLKYVLYVITSGVMVYYGFRLVQFTSKSILPATEWPASMQYIIIPVSGILIIIISIFFLLKIPKEENWVDRYLKEEDDSENQENIIKE